MLIVYFCDMQSLLIIGYVWPEPTATAAGSRMLQLIDLFLQENYKIVFACAASFITSAEDLTKLGVETKTIQPNDASFDTFITTLNPSVVLFDRFLMEEQFGWRVAEQCPDAIRLLDSEDLHFLRKARAKAVKKGEALPKGVLFTEEAKRELASIYRCDATLTISTYEMTYLQEVYGVPLYLLWYVPFMVTIETAIKPLYEERKDFVFVGNFIHAPNWDAVLYLKKELWPLLKKALPDTCMHIYGAYPSSKVFQLHSEAERFLVHGRADAVVTVMQQARVNLAPLRFGAGLKGKLIDAMQAQTPFVTTTIGAEGMFGTFDYNQVIADAPEEFVEKAVALYANKSLWETYQQKGLEVLQANFCKEKIAPLFREQFAVLQKELSTYRQQNFVGSMLQHHTLKSYKYLSKWIEEKNKS